MGNSEFDDPDPGSTVDVELTPTTAIMLFVGMVVSELVSDRISEGTLGDVVQFGGGVAAVMVAIQRGSTPLAFAGIGALSLGGAGLLEGRSAEHTDTLRSRSRITPIPEEKRGQGANGTTVS